MENFTPIRTLHGWSLTVARVEGDPIELELLDPKIHDGAVKGVLVVRCGQALVSDDVVTLTSASRRGQLLKRLKLLGLVLSERALLALEEMCRLAQAPPPREDAHPIEADPPEPMRPLAELLDDVVAFLKRYLVLRSPLHSRVVALWVAHTHALDAFDVTPYLHAHSATKRSGKTRLLELIEPLVPRPWRVAEATAATVFRKIAQDQPVVLLDETDTIWRAKESESAQALRGVLNVGYRRGTMIPRCVGKNFEKLVDFPVFCAKALAGIGRLPDTVADRSICLVFAPKKKHEQTARFRFERARAEAADLRRELARWAAGALSALREAQPAVPEALDDRAAEVWEVLFAIAELAGGDWPAETRRAALALRAPTGEDDAIGVLLLRAIRDTFERLDTARGSKPAGALFDRPEPPPVAAITTLDLLVALIERETEPWGSWWAADVERALEKHKHPQGPANKLAGLLKPFEITSRDIRTDDGTRRGYMRADFADAFERYLGAVETPREKTNASDEDDTIDDTPPEGCDGATTLAAQGFEASHLGSGLEGGTTAETLGGQGLSHRRTSDGGMDASSAISPPPGPVPTCPDPRCPACGSPEGDPATGGWACRPCGRIVPCLQREPGEDDGDEYDVPDEGAGS